MKPKVRRVRLAEFAMQGLEFDDEWIDVLSRMALLPAVNSQISQHQNEIARLQRQMLKEADEEKSAQIRAELEESSEAFLDLIFENQIVAWNLEDAEGNVVPLPKEGRQWKELLPLGVKLKLFEFLNKLRWGDEPVGAEAAPADEEAAPTRKRGRKKRS